MGRIKNYAENWLDQMKVKNPTAYALAEKMVNPQMNEDGAIDIRTFVMLGFGALIVSAFIPMGLEALNTANTSAFSPTELALYGTISVAILIAVVMVFINLAT